MKIIGLERIRGADMDALSFLLSPAGRLLILVIAFIGWTGYQRHDAATEARAECNAEFYQAQITEKDRQLKAARAAADAARERADLTETQLAETKRQADELRKSLSDVPDIPPDVRERLRNIR